MKYNKLNIESIKSCIEYEPCTGSLYVLKDNIRFKRLLPNEEGMLQLSINNTKIKMKYNKFVYFVHTGKMINDPYIIFHRDLNNNNFEFRNLAIITKEQHFKILEALKNLKGALKLSAHSFDMFSYVLEYKENGRSKKEVISDITVAKKKKKSLELKFTKYLGKFIIST